MTVLADSTSPGHEAELPVQNSAGSQAPADARHATLEGSKVSAGQSALAPVQRSSASQGRPLLLRHTVFVAHTSSGHVGEEPSQTSMASQRPFAARQVVPNVFGLQEPLMAPVSSTRQD